MKIVSSVEIVCEMAWRENVYTNAFNYQFN